MIWFQEVRPKGLSDIVDNILGNFAHTRPGTLYPNI